MGKNKNQQKIISPKLLTFLLWTAGLFPLILVSGLLLFQPDESLPPVGLLDNPPELLASVVYSDDGNTELGRYWKVNRTSATYNDISPYVFDALISTEDERFVEHSGVDFKALTRAIVNVGGAGGASTISQQLAKLLYTLQQRERESIARANGESISIGGGKIGRAFTRINEKARENIIATRLERRYTKEEIITMYLNQFDFLYNAVGIENASRVYFNKKPKDLKKEEAAMLVGMCKNPTLYNPHTYEVRNYRSYLANRKKVDEREITLFEIKQKRSQDSSRALKRRNQVLFQWLKNSNANNEALKYILTRKEYDSLVELPLMCSYQPVDHKRGKAPYFREALRKQLKHLFAEKNEDGSLKYKKEDGTRWNIYSDGLKIYTTINVKMQEYAENAMSKHLAQKLQKQFDNNNKSVKSFPFSNTLTKTQINRIMANARRNSPRFQSMNAAGISNEEMLKAFNTPVPMRVFSWKGTKKDGYVKEVDTILTPNDSIRYYKSFLHSGLISIEPQTGFVKAWVGGANIDHFAYDHVNLGKRQVGSTMKPFVYAAALSMGVVEPCTLFPDVEHCVDILDDDGNLVKRWCPRTSSELTGGLCSAARGLAGSKNNITVGVMQKMGGKAGPQTIAKLLANMDIKLTKHDIVPAMCLGSMDLSLLDLVGAQSTFANKGVYVRPTTILRIEDRNGNVIYNANSYSKEVLSAEVAYTMVKMMEGVVTRGTGIGLRLNRPYGNILVPTAGKTGTTQNNSDGWFIGITPELVTGVWVGAEDRGVHFRSTTLGQGARTSLPIYGYYMQKVYKDPKIEISSESFEEPINYTINTGYYCDGEYLPKDDKDTLNAPKEPINGPIFDF